jgi:hypothetical protein
MTRFLLDSGIASDYIDRRHGVGETPQPLVCRSVRRFLLGGPMSNSRSPSRVAMRSWWRAIKSGSSSATFDQAARPAFSQSMACLRQRALVGSSSVGASLPCP